MGPDRTAVLAPVPPRPAATVTVDGVTVGVEAVWAAAGSLAARIVGAPAVAVPGRAELGTVVAVVAGLLAGVPVVPVPADVGRAELAHVLTDSGAALWLGAPHDGVDLPVVAVDPDARGPVPAGPIDPASTAMIMYTSGTTGPPKGVVLRHRAVAVNLDGVAAAWSLRPDDVLAHGLPLFHVHGLLLGLLGPLRLGCSLVHTGRPTPVAYAAAADAGATVFYGVPTVWARVAAAPEEAARLRTARLLVSGSAGLPVPVARRLRELTGLEVLERYGMTETMITIAARDDAPPRTGWVGTPLDGVSTRVCSEDGTVLSNDGESVGELQVRGPMLFDAYLHRPEATAAAFTPDGWFRTGDAAVRDADGWHRIVGRLSTDLLKSGGYRIGAGEVEAALVEHPSVREAAVVGVPDDDLGQRVVAFVVGDGVDPAELVTHVVDLLSVHKRPREVRLVAELPRNAMGKVRKDVLVREASAAPR